MIGSNALVRRYSKALFRVAVEKKSLEKISQDLAIFNDALRMNPDFHRFLLSPEISRKEKEKAVEKLFGDQLSAEFFNFIQILLKNGRQNFFPDMVQEFYRYQDAYFNRINVRATTAIPLSEDELDLIRSRLSKELQKDIVIQPEIDPEILGGIRLRIDSTVFDASLKGQLVRMRSFLAEAPQNQNN
ncbi:MAG: ATP synthase F1 subunit delta [Calditrichaeota bacterium]|nr:ATP synthase F1 subunit delta [Calditrichota bacterium]